MTNANYSLYQQANQFVFAQNLAPDAAAQVVIAGIQFDLATSGRPGARFGPSAIRQASANLGWEKKRHPWHFSLRENLNIADAGDLAFSHGDSGGALEAVKKHVSAVINRGAMPFMLGGDHLITLPALQAIHAKYGPVALVHFDAHTDDYSGGSEFDHGSVFYHARQQGLLQNDKVIQLGIRTEQGTDSPFQIIPAEAMWHSKVDDIVEQIRAKVGNSPVYLTFDIDCLDPVYAPGTGTPVSGGLSGPFVLELIRKLHGFNWVGMDLVEVSPPYDQSDITSLLAATLVTDMLHIIACQHTPALLDRS